MYLDLHRSPIFELLESEIQLVLLWYGIVGWNTRSGGRFINAVARKGVLRLIACQGQTAVTGYGVNILDHDHPVFYLWRS
jgi:hypothetical protein